MNNEIGPNQEMTEEFRKMYKFSRNGVAFSRPKKDPLEQDVDMDKVKRKRDLEDAKFIRSLNLF